MAHFFLTNFYDFGYAQGYLKGLTIQNINSFKEALYQEFSVLFPEEVCRNIRWDIHPKKIISSITTAYGDLAEKLIDFYVKTPHKDFTISLKNYNPFTRNDNRPSSPIMVPSKLPTFGSLSPNDAQSSTPKSKRLNSSHQGQQYRSQLDRSTSQERKKYLTRTSPSPTRANTAKKYESFEVQKNNSLVVSPIEKKRSVSRRRTEASIENKPSRTESSPIKNVISLKEFKM